MTITRAAAFRAVRVIKDTQPTLDAVKDAQDANRAAKEILGTYMLGQKPRLTEFGGVALRIVPFKMWDTDALTVYLGEKLLGKFRTTGHRKYFDIVKRRR